MTMVDSVMGGAEALSSTAESATALVDPLRDQLTSAQQATQPVQDAVMPWTKPIMKTFGGGKKAVGGGAKLFKGIKNRKGKEKNYSLDNGQVVQDKRVNAFAKKQAAFTREKGARDIVTGSLKAGSTVTGWHKAIGGEDSVGGWGDPFDGGMKVANGGWKAVTRGVDAGRNQFDQRRTRRQEHDARKEGNVLALGLQGAKHHLGQQRNYAMGDSAAGAVKATSGALDIASNGDPTQILGRLGAKAFGYVDKGTKKLNKGYQAWNEERMAKKIKKARTKADAGDAQAMQYLLSHDPSMASAQMLMHAQDESKTMEEREQAASSVGKALRFNDGMQNEMINGGSLGEFDKLYSSRTGRKMSYGNKGVGGISKKGMAAVMGHAIGGAHKVHKSTFGKLRKANRKKKDKKYGTFDDATVTEEFAKVRAFRGRKTLEEAENKLAQKDLKKRFKLQEEGKAQEAAAINPFELDPSAGEDEVQEMMKAANSKKGVSGFKQKLPKGGPKGSNDWVLKDMMNEQKNRQIKQAWSAGPTAQPGPRNAPMIGRRGA